MQFKKFIKNGAVLLTALSALMVGTFNTNITGVSAREREFTEGVDYVDFSKFLFQVEENEFPDYYNISFPFDTILDVVSTGLVYYDVTLGRFLPSHTFDYNNLSSFSLTTSILPNFGDQGFLLYDCLFNVGFVSNVNSFGFVSLFDFLNDFVFTSSSDSSIMISFVFEGSISPFVFERGFIFSTREYAMYQNNLMKEGANVSGGVIATITKTVTELLKGVGVGISSLFNDLFVNSEGGLSSLALWVIILLGIAIALGAIAWVSSLIRGKQR